MYIVEHIGRSEKLRKGVCVCKVKFEVKYNMNKHQ